MFAKQGQLIRAVTAGLALAGASLANAAGAPPGEAQVIAQRTKLRELLRVRHDLNTLIADPVTPGLKLLVDHDKHYAPATKSITLSGTPDARLEFRDGVLRVPGRERPADAYDLERAGVVSRAAIDKAISSELHRAAGVERGEDGARSTAAAVDVLTEKVRRAVSLLSKTSSAGLHEDLKLLGTHFEKVTVGRDPKAPLGLHLTGRENADSLSLTSGEVRQVSNHQHVLASFADLQHHGVDTEAALEAMIRTRLLARANLKGDPQDKALVAKARRILGQEIADMDYLTRLITKAVENRDLELIEEFTSANQILLGVRASHFFIGTEGTDSLEAATSIWGMKDGKVSNIDLRDLQRFGIGDRASFDAHVAKRLVATAGIEGDSGNPEVVRKARAALQARVKDAAALKKLIMEPSAHEDLALIRDAYAAMPPLPNGALRSLKIGESNGDELRVGVIQVGELYKTKHQDRPELPPRTIDSYRQVLRERIYVVTAAKPAGYEAKLADLGRFGITSMAKLDAVAREALMRIALEDVQ